MDTPHATVVGDVMTRHVEFVAPEASAQDAATLMGELDVSSLPVGATDRLLGIVTDRDLLYRVVAEGRDPRLTRVLDVATTNVCTCRTDDPLGVAMDLMAAHNIRRLPVLDGSAVVGWLTLSDLSRRLLVDSGIVQRGLQEITGTTPTTDAANGTAAPAADEPPPSEPPAAPAR